MVNVVLFDDTVLRRILVGVGRTDQLAAGKVVARGCKLRRPTDAPPILVYRYFENDEIAVSAHPLSLSKSTRSW
jgi:hypothetical protein